MFQRVCARACYFCCAAVFAISRDVLALAAAVSGECAIGNRKPSLVLEAAAGATLGPQQLLHRIARDVPVVFLHGHCRQEPHYKPEMCQVRFPCQGPHGGRIDASRDGAAGLTLRHLERLQGRCAHSWHPGARGVVGAGARLRLPGPPMPVARHRRRSSNRYDADDSTCVVA